MKKTILSLFLATSASIVTLSQLSLAATGQEERSLPDLIANVEAKKKNFEKKEDEIVDTQLDIDGKMKERDNLRAEYEAALKSYTEEFEKKVKSLTTGGSVAAFGLSELDSKIFPLSSEIEQYNLKIGELQLNKEREDVKISTSQELIKNETAQKVRIDEEISVIKSKRGTLVKSLESERLNRELNELNMSLTKIEDSLRSNETRISALNSDKLAKESEKTEKETLLNSSLSSRTQSDKKTKFRPGQSSTSTSQRSVLEMEILGLTREIAAIQGMIDALISQKHRESELSETLKKQISDKEDEIKAQIAQFSKRKNNSIQAEHLESNQPIAEEDYDSLANREKELSKQSKEKKKIISQNKVIVEQSIAEAKKIDTQIKDNQKERDLVQQQLEQEVREIGQVILSKLQHKKEGGQELTDQEKKLVVQVQQLSPHEKELATSVVNKLKALSSKNSKRDTDLKDPVSVADALRSSNNSPVSEHNPELSEKVYRGPEDANGSDKFQQKRMEKTLDDSRLSMSTQKDEMREPVRDRHSNSAGDLAVSTGKVLPIQSVSGSNKRFRDEGVDPIFTKRHKISDDKTSHSSDLPHGSHIPVNNAGGSSNTRSITTNPSGNIGGLGDEILPTKQLTERNAAGIGSHEYSESSVKTSVENRSDSIQQVTKEDAQKALEILGMARDNLPQKQERESLVSRIQAALENSGISNEKLKNEIFKAVKKKLAIDTNRDKVTYENLVTALQRIAEQH